MCLAWAPGQIALPADSPVYDLMRRYGHEILDRGLFYAESALGPGRVRPALVDGLAAEVLCERSRTAELVVVGARGSCELPHLPLGSVGWQVAGHANRRVVVVRASAGRSTSLRVRSWPAWTVPHKVRSPARRDGDRPLTPRGGAPGVSGMLRTREP